MKAFFIAILLNIFPAAHAADINVAVAANFSNTLSAIVPLFERQTGHRVIVSAGSSGKLYAQISHGAPFDIFLAADEQYPKRLFDEGLAEHPFVYAKGRLVLFSATSSRIRSGANSLRNSKIQHLAIANPATAPYGRAAKEAMRALGVWELLKPKFVYGESVAQAYQFAVSGNAELAFVALSQVMDAKRPISGNYWRVPASLHAPLKQSAVLLKQGSSNDSAKAFLRYLQSGEARAVMATYGYIF